jgi:hypothetical protein
MIPLFIVLGSAGWVEFIQTSSFWKRNQKLYKYFWIFFWVLNVSGLLLFTFTYSKKARVEAMSYLSKYENITAIAVLDEENSPELMPKFYLNQWPVSYSEFVGDLSADSILATSSRYAASRPPAFILITGDKKTAPIVEKARAHFPGLVYETTIEPGFIDKLIHWLNPVNKNRRIFIYRNTEVIPQPKP